MRLFYEIILPLISSKREGDYWDFKEKHHSSKADLLHDIICMANSLHDKDCYIIYGVENGTGNIVGVENDPNRRNQQGVIDFLRSKAFAGHYRPTIELQSFDYKGHGIDVLMILDTNSTPYYLVEKYEDKDNGKGRIVQANAIYTRIGDTNTPINQTADIANVEYLWKKRFGIHLAPYERFCMLIQDKEQWDKSENAHYHKLFPEFTITFESQEEDEYKRRYPEFYSYVMMNPSTSYNELQVNHYGTTLFIYQTVWLDSGRYHTVIPDWGFIPSDQYHQNKLSYKYYVKNTDRYLLHRYLLDENSGDATSALDRFMEVVLFFESEDERSTLEEYVEENWDQVTTEIQSEIASQIRRVRGEEEPAKSKIAEELAIGVVLQRMLEKYRTQLTDGGTRNG